MQKGRSMIEMLGILTIAGVLSIGALYAYRQAMVKHRLNQTKDWISNANLVLTETYFLSEDKNALSTKSHAQIRDLLCQRAGVLFCSDATGVYVNHPYISNAQWAIRYDNTGWRVTFMNLSEEFCAVIATSWWGDNLNALVTSDLTYRTNTPMTQDTLNKIIQRCTFSKFMTLLFSVD